MADWEKQQKYTFLGRLKRLIPLLIVILLAEAAAVLYFRYTFVDWKPCPVNAVSLDWRNEGLTHVEGLKRCRDLAAVDLRGNSLAPEEVMDLREALPDCTVRWDVPMNGTVYDSEALSLEMTDVPDDWENLRYFPNLQSLYFTNCTRFELLGPVQELIPHSSVLWNVALAGEWTDGRMTWLELNGADIQYGELSDQLSKFPALERVEIKNTRFSEEEQKKLEEQYPQIEFLWTIELGGEELDNSVRMLSFGPGREPDMDDLRASLHYFINLETLDLVGCDLTAEDVGMLREENPDLEVLWEVTIAGKEYPCDVTEIDLSGIQLGSVAEVEAAIPYLPRLERIIMENCDIPYAELDAFNRRYEDIRVIWRVYFGNYNLRTDATSFIASAFVGGADLYNEDIWVLRYCTDLQGLDCGHMFFNDLSFLQYTPHMQYLILAECPINDLSDLVYCQELKYLEIFQTPITDLSPLLEIPSLEDLNISYTDVNGRNAWDNLSQMTWLDRLWYCSPPLSIHQQAKLQELMPDCEFYFKRGGEPTGSTWRYHEHYYAMRDLFDMYYMPGGTNGVNDDGDQIIVDDEGNRHVLEDWDGNPMWWEQYG